MNRRFDLHLHSDRSDGRYPPDEVLRRCALGGLDVVALTDHDIAPAIAAGTHVVEGRAVRVIAGVEASGVWEGTELHFLVLFPGEFPADFAAFCAARVAGRVDRYEAARARLAFDLPPPDAASLAGERALTRHHLARALVDQGHAKDLRDAFRRFVGETLGNVPPVDVTADQVIAAGRDAGGVVLWAHPVRDHLHRWLPALVQAGLMGLEGVRPGHNSAERRLARNAARRHDLVLSGGSDWHGWHDLSPGLFAAERNEIATLAERLAA